MKFELLINFILYWNTMNNKTEKRVRIVNKNLHKKSL